MDAAQGIAAQQPELALHCRHLANSSTYNALCVVCVSVSLSVVAIAICELGVQALMPCG